MMATRERKRIDSLKIDKETIANRIHDFYTQDHQDRKWEIDARLQRYAKYRMWREGKDWPWPDATDIGLPDMMTAAMRLEDTLHNAVMASRPPIQAKAMRPTDKEKESDVNNLLDFQFFEEQRGEEIVGQIADDFVIEGLFTAYTPWIDEKRVAKEIKVYDPLPVEVAPVAYFLDILHGFYPKAMIEPAANGWDFKIQEDKRKFAASFWTRSDEQIELELTHEVGMFNGPRCIRKDVQDVLHPARCENLQIQCASNPMGASHVIVRDFPSIDELKRLRKSGFYDLMTEEDADRLGLTAMDTSNQEREQQKDVMQGHVQARQEPPKGAESHKQLTRLMCFDCFDIDNDGLDEDVVFWMILETKTILKAVYLSQVFPSGIPRRPFAEGSLFPVPGRRLAIGMLEMMEGLHDLMKQFFDQGGDAGTLANSPFGFYRASGNMRPEVIRMQPGDLYPLTDPRNDVNFPQFGNQSQSFMFNMVTLISQIEEKLTNIGDLQLGRVPAGKSSALRTVAGMQTVLSQGDARPERVLRRFFMGLAQIFQNFHELNEVMLPSKKRFMISGPVEPGKDPYRLVESKNDIRGKFRFTFSANVLNTSKEALQGALQDLMGAYLSPLAIQLGIIKPDGAYRLLRDYGKSKGQDPDKYISPPTPAAMLPPINWQEAVMSIIDGIMPQGSPMEGGEAHLKALNDFAASDDFRHLDQSHIPLFRAYIESVAQAMAQERAMLALQKAAGQMGGQGAPGTPGPAAGPQDVNAGNPAVQGNELLDESLPGAGGGGNQGVMA